MNETTTPLPMHAPHTLPPPVVVRFPADLTTPVRAFRTLTRSGQEGFLLESVAGGESQARYSFVGVEPTEVFEGGERPRIRRGQEVIFPEGPAREALRSWVRSHSAGEPPVPFLGGCVGWIDFSSAALYEDKLAPSFPEPRTPRFVFGLFSKGIVFDHLKQQGYLYARPQSEEAKEAAREELARMEKKLFEAMPPDPPPGKWTLEKEPDRRRFLGNVAAVKEAILDGDAYQVVVSEPFEGRFDGDPFEVYRRLRRLNPSPYHFYVSLEGRQVVGASPEMLVRVEDGEVTTVPIAGTRPRGTNPAEDARLERELLADPKELAEHAMLVDLARNDLGRFSQYGSVSVPVRGVVERFSHVMHITSRVQGRLTESADFLDALWATFPAGTVCGAPKIRAVEILSRLEGEDRGVYGGAVGTVDGSGNLETCIAIRTLEFEEGRARFRSGAGIVMDSDPVSEWEEIHHKAGVLIAALDGDGLGREKP